MKTICNMEMNLTCSFNTRSAASFFLSSFKEMTFLWSFKHKKVRYSEIKSGNELENHWIKFTKLLSWIIRCYKLRDKILFSKNINFRGRGIERDKLYMWRRVCDWNFKILNDCDTYYVIIILIVYLLFSLKIITKNLLIKV